MKRHFYCSLAAWFVTASGLTLANDYFVVVPVPGKTASRSVINVSLAGYTLPAALVGQGYSYDLKPLLSVTGDSAYTGAGVTWSVVESTLPAGLTFSSDGVITGTPTAAGSGAITARATYKGLNGEQTYQVVSSQITVTLASAALPVASVGQAYTYNLSPLLSVSGDSGFSPASVAWDVSQGSLPDGLSLSDHGVLSGTPTAASSGPVTVRATYKNAQGQQAYQLVVLDIKVTLAAGTPPQANVGKSYSFDLKPLLTVSGDPDFQSAGVAWYVNGDQVPDGLNLTADGVIQGTPTVKNLAGTSVTILASYKSKSGTQAYTIVVGGQILEVTKISVGGSHTCALTAAGGVKCWGSNSAGQLGNKSTTDSTVPVDVSGLSAGVANIASGYTHTCALTSAGGMKCWGDNAYGELGNGGSVNSTVPVDVLSLTSGVSSLAVGAQHSCALMTAGSVKCWGRNDSGQLGDGSLNNNPMPVTVAGLTASISQLSAGFFHTCALTTTGGAKCWGANSFGQIGNGSVAAQQLQPADVTGLTTGVAVLSGGQGHTCAVTTAGGLKCWGNNYNGQLGNNSTASSATPTTIYSSGIAKIATGASHTCAVTTAGAALCWGLNNKGQLGTSDTASRLMPAAVTGLSAGIASLSAGGSQTCAVTTAGSVKCWGNNAYGQLGSGNTSNSALPIDVLNTP